MFTTCSNLGLPKQKFVLPCGDTHNFYCQGDAKKSKGTKQTDKDRKDKQPATSDIVQVEQNNGQIVKSELELVRLTPDPPPSEGAEEEQPDLSPQSTDVHVPAETSLEVKDEQSPLSQDDASHPPSAVTKQKGKSIKKSRPPKRIRDKLKLNSRQENSNACNDSEGASIARTSSALNSSSESTSSSLLCNENSTLSSGVSSGSSLPDDSQNSNNGIAITNIILFMLFFNFRRVQL